MENTTPKLCGGFFFNLLLMARKERYTHLENSKGKRDGISDYEMLGDLVRIVNPKHQDCSINTMKKNTSEYKSCILNNSQWLPFNDVSFINEFNIQMRENYNQIEKRVTNYATRYLNLDSAIKYRTIAHFLLEIIQSDDSINDTDLFYFGQNDFLKKNEMTPDKKYELHSLLLSIFHYIISNNISNQVGIETYSSWSTSSGGKHSNKLFNPQIQIEKYKSTIILSLSINNIKFENDVDLTSNFELTPSNKIIKYLKKVTNKYNKLKTLLYTDEPHKFYDFYVCNELVLDIHKMDYDLYYLYQYGTQIKDHIEKPTIDYLTKNISNFIILSGTGGLGKSMMMRHLLLSAANDYENTNTFPIFISLKDFTETYNDLFSFVYNKVSDLSTLSETDLKNSLMEGKVILLLDGLDEIKSKDLPYFYSALESFADRYSNNTFILSTRPYSDTIHLSRFTSFRLIPFSKEKALELIDKLEFRPDEPDIKLKFRAQLDNILYESHKEFASNPLLLTIMLMTFEQYAEVPQKMHIFYREAFNTLAQKHDASKGAYKRILKSGLSTDRFADYLAEFCARTYYQEKFEFTESEFKNYFEELEEKNRYEDEKVSSTAFLQDLRENMCLLYYEGNKYHFTHRSFQEYFCAVFFSKQKDKTLSSIGNMFEKKQDNSKRDQTFNMLYDMIPEKIEEYIFLPYLKKLINQFDKNDGYLTFLEKIYPVIQYIDVDDNYESELLEDSPFLSNHFVQNENMYLYYFIRKNKNLSTKYKNLSIPVDETFIEQYIYKPFGNENSIPIIHVPILGHELFTENFIKDTKIKLIGRIYEIKIKKVLSDKEKYKDIINALCDKNFPKYIEYQNLKDYFEKINKKKKPLKDDFFSKFF